MLTIRQWVALNTDEELSDPELRSFGRMVASSYRYDRIEPPLKYKKVCVYDIELDKGIIQKTWIAFRKRK